MNSEDTRKYSAEQGLAEEEAFPRSQVGDLGTHLHGAILLRGVWRED